MTLLKARHLGMCFGVRDAITLAHAEARNGNLSILGELVHNPIVTDELKRHGLTIQSDPARIPTRRVMITAHGASNTVVHSLQARGLDVIEATCPLVHHAHQQLATLVTQGFHPVVVGIRHHVEVQGLIGDHPGAEVILTEADVDALPPHPRIGIVAQTTQPLDKVEALVSRIRKRFPESTVRFVDTVCQPTKLRQTAADNLAQAADVVVVIGGFHSNNTRELVGRCRRHCGRVHHVESDQDLETSWFLHGDVVGVTAGTSTPDHVIDNVTARLEAIAAALATRIAPDEPALAAFATSSVSHR